MKLLFGNSSLRLLSNYDYTEMFCLIKPLIFTTDENMYILQAFHNQFYNILLVNINKKDLQ